MIPVLLLLFLLISGCSPAPSLYKETQLLMGTTVEVTIEGEREKSSEISKRLFQRLKRLEAKFSLYNSDSEIVSVNKKAYGEKLKISPEFFGLLERSIVYSELTGGAFDITVSPLVKLWGFREHKPHLPEEGEIKKTLERCGYTGILLSGKENGVSFSKPLEIDMAGIATGYIVDEGIKFLKREGVQVALINAGGDIYCMGSPRGKEGWTVAIRHPRRKDNTATQFNMQDKGITTSGDYENFFLHEGKYLSHIIDPRTGWPTKSGVVSATVIASDTTEADALATALVVMGGEKGIELIERLDGVEAIIISIADGRLTAVVSTGLKDKLKFEF